MDDIADRAGVSKPVLYQHFPGKLELYLALLDAHCDALVAARPHGAGVDRRTTSCGSTRRSAAYFDFVDDESGGLPARLRVRPDATSRPCGDRVDARRGRVRRGDRRRSSPRTPACPERARRAARRRAGRDGPGDARVPGSPRGARCSREEAARAAGRLRLAGHRVLPRPEAAAADAPAGSAARAARPGPPPTPAGTSLEAGASRAAAPRRPGGPATAPSATNREGGTVEVKIGVQHVAREITWTRPSLDRGGPRRRRRGHERRRAGPASRTRTARSSSSRPTSSAYVEIGAPSAAGSGSAADAPGATAARLRPAARV